MSQKSAMIVEAEKMKLQMKTIIQEKEEIIKQRTKQNKKRVEPIKNKEWIALIKNKNTMRIFVVNLHHFGPEDKKKIDNLQKKANTNSINCLLFSSIGRMWNATNKSKIKRKSQSINRNTEINTADSGRYEEVKN